MAGFKMTANIFNYNNEKVVIADTDIPWNLFKTPACYQV